MMLRISISTEVLGLMGRSEGLGAGFFLAFVTPYYLILIYSFLWLLSLSTLVKSYLSYFTKARQIVDYLLGRKLDLQPHGYGIE